MVKKGTKCEYCHRRAVMNFEIQLKRNSEGKMLIANVPACGRHEREVNRSKDKIRGKALRQIDDSTEAPASGGEKQPA